MTEPSTDIDQARDAVRRESWSEANDRLRPLDPAELDPEDLEGLADATWWLGRIEESFVRRQQAYSGYASAGRDPEASFVAGRLCMEHFYRGEPAVAAGWLMRATRHLRDQPECVQHGFLALIEATAAYAQGQTEPAMTLAERATAIGQRFAHPDLLAMSIHTQGLVLIATGRVADGMALLDEAMTAVVADELSSFFTGVIYCDVLRACLDVADLARAGEWNEAARAWTDALLPQSPFPGRCRINRAELASLRGNWSEADAEATRACEELISDPIAAAAAFYEAGEIRRRIGDTPGAEEAFSRAHELGYEPQPGLALLRLAQGKPAVAHTALLLALGAESGNRLHRARLLAAGAEVAIAAGDVMAAERAAGELEAIAVDFGTPALDAAAATARGVTRLAAGDVPGAIERLRHACALWQKLRLPYEAARARVQYGVALRSAGDEEPALFEIRAALSAFEQLGASGDATRASELLDRADELPRGLTSREAQVLGLVASGKTNREIAADLVISEHTVARHVQNIFAKLEVSSRAAATAFAFEHGLT